MSESFVEVFRCTVTGPPVPQGRARISRSGHHIMAPKSRAWRAWAQSFISHQRMRHPMAALDGILAMSLVVVQARPKSRPDRVDKALWKSGARCLAASQGDLDNFAKAIKDALTDSGLWTDDHLVAAYVAPFGKWYAAEGEEPHLEVVVYRVEVMP